MPLQHMKPYEQKYGFCKSNEFVSKTRSKKKLKIHRAVGKVNDISDDYRFQKVVW